VCVYKYIYICAVLTPCNDVVNSRLCAAERPARYRSFGETTAFFRRKNSFFHGPRDGSISAATLAPRVRRAFKKLADPPRARPLCVWRYTVTRAPTQWPLFRVNNEHYEIPQFFGRTSHGGDRPIYNIRQKRYSNVFRDRRRASAGIIGR